jgi:NAD(P)-dependent dehydrogenase (short-subunit alcohol dehydrogenase family)
MTNASQHVVIIGGTSGIGLAAAQRLAVEGARVTVAGRDPARLARAREALGDTVSALPLDASNPAQVREFFAALGAFDHLVLALGSGRGAGPFAGLDLDQVRRGFEEKVWPHLLCAQTALATIRKDGSITFVTAVSGQMTAPGTAGLAAANGALSIVAPVLAAELRPLRVNAVSPGVVDTAWWDFLPNEQRRSAFADFARRTPVGRVGAPDDIARAIAFLIADEFMSGHVLVCDGGLRVAA